MGEYRYQATTIEGYVQQIATAYLRHGYLWYLQGTIPPQKLDRAPEIDQRIMSQFNVGLSRRKMAKFKAQKISVQHYLRFGPFWVVLSNAGSGDFFEKEKPRHFSNHPLIVGPYAIEYRHGRATFKDQKLVKPAKHHAKVSIAPEEMQLLKAQALEHFAVHRTADWLRGWFFNLPYEPYWGVRRQLYTLLTAVNKKRKKAGFDLVEKDCIRYKRNVVKPYAPIGADPVNEDSVEMSEERAA